MFDRLRWDISYISFVYPYLYVCVYSIYANVCNRGRSSKKVCFLTRALFYDRATCIYTNTYADVRIYGRIYTHTYIYIYICVHTKWTNNRGNLKLKLDTFYRHLLALLSALKLGPCQLRSDDEDGSIGLYCTLMDKRKFVNRRIN